MSTHFRQSIPFKLALSFCLLIAFACGNAQETPQEEIPKPELKKEPVLAINQTESYLKLLEGKKVALVANHTSVLGGQHLVDTLLKLNIDIQKVFSPEHGFRGNADAGEQIQDQVDEKTGLELISLYGKNKKPKAEQLKGLDLILFDIQDVGARFYTYISTLHYVMEAAAENNISLFVLDRPNPNGNYVDGPVLEKGFTSFVGMHQVPVVHGMTIGEYAQMINGEGWLKNGVKCDLSIISCLNYTHDTKYDLPIPPSPNLPNANSIYWYPSLCFFEGTAISVGRGTEKPFQHIGHPDLKFYSYVFRPKAMEGAKNPKYLGQDCYGRLMPETGPKEQLDLQFLIEFYEQFPKKSAYFNSFFKLLAGTDQLQKQIESGMSEAEIRKSWEQDLKQFKEIRKKYLLYPDFSEQ